MQVRACPVVRGPLAIGHCGHCIHVSIQGVPTTMGSPRQTGGDGGFQCVPAPVLVRGEVQVDRHSIAFLVGTYCPRHGEKSFQMPKSTMHQSIGRIPGFESCYWCGDEYIHVPT